MLTDGPSSIPPQGPKGSNEPLEPVEPNNQAPMEPVEQGKQMLGMNFTQAQYAKFLSQMMSLMMNQIKENNDRMLQAIRKLKDQD